MSSQYVTELLALAKALADEGWDRRSIVCYESAMRMERMEKVMVAMNKVEEDV